MVRPAGLEPATLGLEGRCSIQMSYGRIVLITSLKWSGWRDSNSRHPAPKAGALPDCATPRIICSSEQTRNDTLQDVLGQLLNNTFSIKIATYP